MKLITASLLLFTACATAQPCDHADLGFRLTARTEAPQARSSLLSAEATPPALAPGQLVRITIHNPGPARTVRLDCTGVERILVDVAAGTEETVLFRVKPEPGLRFSCEAS